jgi:hypothetical protein
MKKDFNEMSPLEHLEAAKALLVTITDAAKDLQDLLDDFKPAV